MEEDEFREQEREEYYNAIEKEHSKKVKRYDHIPVRPATFAEFRRLKNTRSDNSFILELLKVFKDVKQ